MLKKCYEKEFLTKGKIEKGKNPLKCYEKGNIALLLISQIKYVLIKK